MRERSSHTTVSNTVHSGIYNTLTETCDSVESLGGRFRIHLKNTTRIMAPLSVDFLSCIVTLLTSQAQIVGFPALQLFRQIRGIFSFSHCVRLTRGILGVGVVHRLRSMIAPYCSLCSRRIFSRVLRFVSSVTARRSRSCALKPRVL